MVAYETYVLANVQQKYIIILCIIILKNLDFFKKPVYNEIIKEVRDMKTYGDYLYEDYLEETRKSDRVALAFALAKARLSEMEDNKNGRRICEGPINQEENKRIDVN